MRTVLLLLFLAIDSTYSHAQSCTTPYRIVVLGSSTAAGTGATPNHGWVALYTQYLKSINTNYQVFNLAVGNYTTYDINPTGYVPPAARPAPDTAHNITKALSLQPHAIIINLPTNDVGRGYTLAEQQANYQRVLSAANARGVKVWVATTQPRNDYSAQMVANLKAMRDWTFNYFGERSIDFWTGMNEPNDSIKRAYSYGDGIHLNDAGHYVLYTRVVARGIPDVLCNGNPPQPQIPVVLTAFTLTNNANRFRLNWTTAYEKNVSRFVVERSSDSLRFSVLANVMATGNDSTGKSYTYPDTALQTMKQFYRLNVIVADTHYIYTGIVRGVPVPAQVPVIITALSVTNNTSKLQVNWTTGYERSVTRFAVERSSDSLRFVVLANVAGTGNGSTGKSYIYLDTGIHKTKQFYRLNVIVADTHYIYSSIVRGIPDTAYGANTYFNITGFQVQSNQNKLQLLWYSNNEKSTRQFIIERSADSSNWNAVGTLAAAGNYPGSRFYNFTDPNIYNRLQYYRLNMETTTGLHFFSTVIKGMPDTMYTQPFRIASLSVALQQTKAQLRWTTSAEKNTKSFTVERSPDASVWTAIGTVNAAGNSTTTRNYTFQDPVTQTGTVSYRLNMLTHDNRRFFSSIVKLTFPSTLRAADKKGFDAFYTTEAGPIRIAPNPVKENTWLLGLTAGNHDVRIFDAGGRMIYCNPVFQTGRSIDASRWAQGLYIIIIDDGRHQLKLMKQ
ncbi:SGNH/GDSL hydrolase family protein [Chitinophaga pinensis]|uniref:Lipolytic protein G-D-S-L family n=1 Tax=Chitinophaga pinensis (strain ATCC 43595 / DSM 2588 / LMG 13176 / NBRC 15968 / NCIMB 11800 / UQM 2034) TaxID=485918 RepID=A0A979G726_CHIPD|nr:SGNH/GDSL hydrolase family protein [Chitinophaga pinensis]ACU61847.1 lipolytic protein G-D-S-L family [Chitinophaga pinensis DSM 2588]